MAVDILSKCSQSSFLSPNVYQLICVEGVAAERSGEADGCGVGLTDQGTIDWDYVQKQLSESEDEHCYYQTCVRNLSGMFAAVRRHIQSLSAEGFDHLYSDKLKWTRNEELFIRCFELIAESTELSMLLCTTALERALGDVYLLKGHLCPSMLKDLLVSKQLEEIIGPTAIQLLRVVIGPCISLNIRNVLWHGFAAPGQIPEQYACLLLVIIASIGELLDQSSVMHTDIPHRPSVIFYQMALLRATFQDLTDENLNCINHLFEESMFIVPVFRPYWLQAVHKYQQHRFGECTVLLLPQIEHGLRCVFATVNNCPERVLTAESTTLFTTFDEILKKYLPDGTENSLRSTLGDGMMDLLFDLLVYPDGPRVRDRISHGETDLLSTTPMDVAHHVLCISVALCLQFVETNFEICQDSCMIQIGQAARNYQSIFHPIAQLKRKILEFSQSLSSWQSLPRPPGDQLETVIQWDDIDTWRSNGVQTTAILLLSHSKHLPPYFNSITEPFRDVSKLLKDILSLPISTLYRGEKSSTTEHCQVSDLELVGHMLRIVDKCTDVSSQIRSLVSKRYGQWERRELRSRQRDTYRRMLDSIVPLSQGLRLVMLIVLSQLCALDELCNLSAGQQRNLVRFLRAVLQYSENLFSYTSADRNKWEESCTLTNNFVIKVRNFYSSL